MPVSQPWNGNVYSLPLAGDNDAWGNDLTTFFQAIANNALSRDGGIFILANPLDLGPTAGLTVLDLSSRGPNVATSGTIRLANNNSIVFRDAANANDLALEVVADRLTFRGNPVGEVFSYSIRNNNSGGWFVAVGTNHQQTTLVQGSASLAGSIVLPSGATDGQVFNISASGFTTGTITWSSGVGTVVGAPSTITVNTGITFIFEAGTSTFRRIK